MKNYHQCQKNQPLCSIIILTKAKNTLKRCWNIKKTRQKLLILQQNYDGIVRKHSSDNGLTHLEEMTIDTDQNFSPVVRKPYLLPLKHHKFVKDDIENLLEAGLIKGSMSPYAAPFVVVPRKSKPGAPPTRNKD